MSKLLVFVDVQNVWTKNNPRMLRSLMEAEDQTRGRVPRLWIFSDWVDVEEPTQLKDFAVGNYAAEEHLLPSVRVAPDDWIVSKDEVNAFANEKLKDFVRRHGFTELQFAGFEAHLCVPSTAIGGRQVPGVRTSTIIKDLVSQGIGDHDVSPETLAGYRRRHLEIADAYQALGVDLSRYNVPIPRPLDPF